MTPAPSEDERVYLRKMEIAQQRQAESDQIARDQAAEIERLRGALRAMAARLTDERRESRCENRWANHYKEERDLVIREHREAAKAYNHTASQLLRERDEAFADLAAARAQCDELRTQAAAKTTPARLVDPMTRRIGQLEIALRRLVDEVERDDGVDMTPLWDRAKEVLADNRIVADGLYVATTEPVETTRPRPGRALSFDESMDLIEQRYGDTIRSEVFDDETVPAQFCAHHGDDNYFDRTLCAPPCDVMHTRCRECGKPLDPCAHDLHPRDEACIHCATPARLASADPVIDCPREECPRPRPTAVADEKKENR